MTLEELAKWLDEFIPDPNTFAPGDIPRLEAAAAACRELKSLRAWAESLGIDREVHSIDCTFANGEGKCVSESNLTTEPDAA